MPIRIRSKKAGFRRCGMAHPAEWITHADDAFTPGELERLKAEPMLQVQVIEAQPAPPVEPATVQAGMAEPASESATKPGKSKK